MAKLADGMRTMSAEMSAIRQHLSGVVTNAGQQISRIEALRLYTSGAAWFAFDDHHLGSFERGKYADLAVLSHDYLTVPEQMIRRIESVLTIVAGRIVHASAPFESPAAPITPA